MSHYISFYVYIKLVMKTIYQLPGKFFFYTDCTTVKCAQVLDCDKGYVSTIPAGSCCAECVVGEYYISLHS